MDLQTSKQVAIAAVHTAAVGLGAALKSVTNVQDSINQVRVFIDPIRFNPDGLGYFYVYDYDCINIAHATQKDLQGQNLYDHQDTRGKYVIRELALAAKNGGGFVEFYWVKPGDTGEHPKLGYVEPIPNTNYFIGSGVYLAE
ncbi:MAG: C50 carotenoid epsilon cyclase [Acidobacteria bacterium]|nr:MAG: C50 carotenoid epsilon cyclase [Acidobacteriota bacterium]